MSDRELLEQAAKAAGLTLRGWSDSWSGEPGECGYQLADFSRWNPLTDDGDAMRLAVKLRIQVEWTRTLAKHHDEWLHVSPQSLGHLAEYARIVGDPCAVTRRAIVRAAAAIAENAAEQRQDERAK